MSRLTRIYLLVPVVAALVLSLGCRGRATLPAAVTLSFPRQTLDFFDATSVHPNARDFQLAVYDVRGKRAIFIPWV